MDTCLTDTRCLTVAMKTWGFFFLLRFQFGIYTYTRTLGRPRRQDKSRRIVRFEHVEIKTENRARVSDLERLKRFCFGRTLSAIAPNGFRSNLHFRSPLRTGVFSWGWGGGGIFHGGFSTAFRIRRAAKTTTQLSHTSGGAKG